MLRKFGLIFEWDQNKSDKNFAERGFDFEYACEIFGGDIIEWDDIRRDYGERRVNAIGEVDEVVYVVVYITRTGPPNYLRATSIKEGARCLPQGVHRPRFLEAEGAWTSNGFVQRPTGTLPGGSPRIPIPRLNCRAEQNFV
jgi:uncharacterized protein